MSAHPFLVALDGHTLARGSHSAQEVREGEHCALEVAALARGVGPTDDPHAVGLPDLRPLNDACWSSDALRTEHLSRVVMAWWDVELTPERAARLAELTIRRILPMALRAAGLGAEAERCEREGSEDAARAASNAAEAAADRYATADRYAAGGAAARYAAAGTARAAGAAADAAANAADTDRAAARYAARYAAYAAADAAADAADADAVLIEACDVWVEVAQ